MTDTETVFNAVAKATGISRAKMLSKSRLWPIVEARMLFILFLSRQGNTDELISWKLGRNRTTILKARHNAENYIGISRTFAGKFKRLTEIYEAS